MKNPLGRAGSWGTVLAVGVFLAATCARGQSMPEPKPLLAEQAFKNIQVFRGTPAQEFMETMGFFAASLDANCTHCHELGSWENYAKDNPSKEAARKMVVMMNSINQTYFGGRQVVTCYSCHRFSQKPKVIPSLALQYSDAPDEEPDEVLVQAKGEPTPDQVLDKYYKAVGGEQKLAAIGSFIAKGTWQGYDDTEQHPFELLAKAPGQVTTTVENHGDVTTRTYDGTNGWIAAPDTDVPVTLVTLAGSDLDNARIDAALAFPGRIKQFLTDLRVGPSLQIDGKDVTLLQGYSPAKSPVKLFFDSDSGLLLRVVRYTSLKVGKVPTQFDYSDYRDVNGVKMPFYWLTTWVDGRSKTQLTSVQLNAAIPAAKFAKPAAPPHVGASGL